MGGPVTQTVPTLADELAEVVTSLRDVDDSLTDVERRLRDLTADGLPVGPARASQVTADALDRLAARTAALAATARASATVTARHLSQSGAEPGADRGVGT
jgi:hypothetical protein